MGILLITPLSLRRGDGGEAVTGAFQAFAGALVGIERCRGSMEMASLSPAEGGEMPAESIVNIYQTTGVSLIKLFF